MYQDNAFKYVAILNRNVPPGRMLNVLAHGANALQRKLREAPGERFDLYLDADGGEHGEFSKWPYIVLEASSSEKLRNARLRLRELGAPVVDFTSSMLGASHEEQLRQTRSAPESELEYLGLFTFGPSPLLDQVCKKFSLFKAFVQPGAKGVVSVPAADPIPAAPLPPPPLGKCIDFP